MFFNIINFLVDIVLYLDNKVINYFIFLPKQKLLSFNDLYNNILLDDSAMSFMLTINGFDHEYDTYNSFLIKSSFLYEAQYVSNYLYNYYIISSFKFNYLLSGLCEYTKLMYLYSYLAYNYGEMIKDPNNFIFLFNNSFFLNENVNNAYIYNNKFKMHYNIFNFYSLIFFIFKFLYIKNLFISIYIYIIIMLLYKKIMFKSLNIFIYKLFNEYSNNVLNKNSIKNIISFLLTNFIVISISYVCNIYIFKSYYNIFMFFFFNIVISFIMFKSFKTRLLIIIKGFYSNFKIISSLFYDTIGFIIFFSRFTLQSVRVISCIFFFYLLNEYNLIIWDILNSYNNYYNHDNSFRENFFVFVNLSKSFIEYLDTVISFSINNIVFIFISILLISFLLTFVNKKSYYFLKKKNINK